jgi:hypothetical protein
MGLPEEGPRVTTPASDTLTGRQDRIQREKAILDQLPLLHYIARCIHKRLTRHVLLEDLVHASVIGLIDALGKFDPPSTCSSVPTPSTAFGAPSWTAFEAEIGAPET